MFGDLRQKIAVFADLERRVEAEPRSRTLVRINAACQ